MYNHITKAFERHLKQAYASNDIIRDGSIGHLQNLSFQIGGNDYFFNDKLFEETFGVKVSSHQGLKMVLLLFYFVSLMRLVIMQ